MSTTRPSPRSPQLLLETIQTMGYSPASLAHIGPKRAEAVVTSAIEQTSTINASHARQDKRAQKRRRDALRAIRGRAEPGHPGCSCVDPNPEQGLDRKGHARTCVAWLGSWSREDELEALYGDKL